MNTHPATSRPATSSDADPDTAVYGARVIAVVALLLGIVEVGFGVLVAVDTAHTTGDAAMFSVFGYVLAGMVGVPGALAIVLDASSLAIRRNVTAAYVTASAGALAALLPVLMFLVQHR
ncbi:MAG TPA: hypothetical protein VN088_13625 [Nocardioides sp.]|nr:hypothetical protein [Nocardioides sp.]